MLINYQPLLVISQIRIEAINQGPNAPQSGPNHAIFLLLALALLSVSVAAGVRCLYKKRAERPIEDPEKLFQELCRAYGLSASHRRALHQLAEIRQLKDPNLILFDASYWVLDPTSDQQLCKPRTRNRLLMLQRILFTVPAGSTTPSLPKHQIVCTAGTSPEADPQPKRLIDVTGG